MSVLKAPPKQPKNATLQIRVDEELRLKLDKYAEFLDSTAAYVVSEALRLVFNKDAEFKQWLESQATTRHGIRCIGGVADCGGRQSAFSSCSSPAQGEWQRTFSMRGILLNASLCVRS